jgi:SIR2-like domain
MSPPEPTTAATITIRETLDLLDGHARPVADGIANGNYALWLGSGISINSAPGLTGAIQNVLEFLQMRADTNDEACEHHKALKGAIKLADLGEPMLSEVDLTRAVGEWANLQQILKKLVGSYSQLLDLRVHGKKEDYLVWDGVDIPGTYGKPLEPGSEHLCLAILALEGAIHDVPSANWDGLIEIAVRQLAEHPDQALEVVVLSSDFQDPSGSPRLLKFHGCAVLAVQDEERYRPTLIGTSSRITGWTEAAESKVMCSALTQLATEQRTLMIGLSAQDVDIQNVFTKAKGQMSWTWPTASPAYAFAEQEIGLMQKNLLKVVYREHYEAHGKEIEEAALIPAYAEPLLTALVLDLLTSKLNAYITVADAPGILVEDRGTLTDGIRHIRDEVAEQCEGDRLESLRLVIQAQGRSLGMFRTGKEPPADDTTYLPLSGTPVARIPTEPGLTPGGMPELASALGVLGRGDAAGMWSLRVEPSTSANPGAFTVTSGTGTDVAIHFAANNGAAVKQEALESVRAAPEKTIMIHSTQPVGSSARNPRVTYGRTGHAAIRHVDMEDLLSRCSSTEELEQRFRLAASI